MKKNLVCLDVGEKRIGVAIADSSIRIAIPYDVIEVDGTEVKQITELLVRQNSDLLIAGLPRGQKGGETSQTEFVRNFMENFKDFVTVAYQDESLTSVIAEKRLKERRAPYSKGDIDKEAASIILQDYLEENYG